MKSRPEKGNNKKDGESDVIHMVLRHFHLFPHVKEEQLTRVAVVFLHARHLGMLADLFQKQLRGRALPVLSPQAEYKGSAVHHALQPELRASDPEIGLGKQGEGDLLSHLQHVVGKDHGRIGDLTEIALKAYLLRQDTAALSDHEFQSSFGVNVVLLAMLLKGYHFFSPYMF